MSGKKIYICYSENDLAVARQLATEFRNKGIEVLYREDMPLDSTIDQIVANGIASADYFLVILSKKYVDSQYMQSELSRAEKLDKTIFLVIIEDCKVPGQLSRLQPYDFKDNREWAMKSLISNITLDDGPGYDGPVTAKAPVPREGAFPKRKGRFAGLLGGLIRKKLEKKEDTSVYPAELSEEAEAGNTGGNEGESGYELMLPGKVAGIARTPETGVLAHSIPTKMQLQNTHRCIIRIGFDEVTIIKNFPERNREIVVKKDIRVSDTMEVEFLPNPHFEITALNGIKQPVDAYEYTEWNFDVMPKSVGAFPLTFRISIFLPNGSKEMILRETITVVTEEVEAGEVFIPSDLMSLAAYYKMLNKKLKIVTLFLASSSELADDRRAFEILIGRKNKNLIKENIYLDLIIWEDFLDAMSATRLQDEYDKAIVGCDVFVSLFHTKVGKYTEEEFLKALEAFNKNKRPLIYTYFKTTEVKMASLVNFQEQLRGLGHFHTRYKDTDDLNYQFGEQIVKFLPMFSQ